MTTRVTAPSLKPLIGITSELRPKALAVINLSAHVLLTSYTEAIKSAGGLPLVLPLGSEATSEDTLRRLDGLLLTGDIRDVPPAVLGQEPHPKSKPTSMERWESDARWLMAARSLGTPVLAICFGMQLPNVVEGGSIVQDIPDLVPEAGPHITPELDLDHRVTIEEGSLLASLAPALRASVRSTHHQAVAEAAPEYRVVARADDGIIEAIEHPDEAFLLGVQWHPEMAATQPDWLLEGFVRHCMPGEPH